MWLTVESRRKKIVEIFIVCIVQNAKEEWKNEKKVKESFCREQNCISIEFFLLVLYCCSIEKLALVRNGICSKYASMCVCWVGVGDAFFLLLYRTISVLPFSLSLVLGQKRLRLHRSFFFFFSFCFLYPIFFFLSSFFHFFIAIQRHWWWNMENIEENLANNSEEIAPMVDGYLKFEQGSNFHKANNA